MSDLYPVPDAFAAQANVTRADYERDYAESIRDPEPFGGRVAKRLDWMKPPTRIRDVSFDRQNFRIRWFADGELYVSVNCLDRHLDARGDKTALIFEPDGPDAEAKHIGYRELHARVCRLGNALRNLGIGKGDRVTI